MPAEAASVPGRPGALGVMGRGRAEQGTDRQGWVDWAWEEA